MYIHVFLLFQETKVERSKRSHSPIVGRVSNPVKKLKPDEGGNCVVEIIVFYILCIRIVHKYVTLVTN